MLLVGIVLCATFFFSCLILRTVLARKPRLKSPPSPLALPIIGHLYILGPKIHKTFHELAVRYGPLIQLRLGSVPCVVVSTAELAKEFLKINELTFSARKNSNAIKILTYNSSSFAFSPYGPYWKFIKKLCIYELLGARNLNHFRPVRTTEISSFVQLLMNKAKSSSGSKPINITEELLSLTSNVISQMMLSIRCSENEGDAATARTVIREVTQIFGEFDASDMIWLCKNFDFQGIKKRSEDIQRRYDALLEKIIADRERVRRQNREVRTADSGAPAAKEAMDFLDILLDVMESGNAEVKFTRDHLKALILDFFTAGTDTTAIAIEWALAELINHPSVLKKAQEEIEEVVGSHRLVQESDASNLPYIQAIIKETFRLHPPIPMLARKSTTDCEIKGYTIPAGTLLFVNIWSIGRNRKYWDNPLEFRPERFLEPSKDSNEDTIDVKGQHFELLPFGTGRRGCPGMLLALQEVHTVLAAMVQCFDWKLPPSDGDHLGGVDMSERPGLTAPRAHDLVCLLVPRVKL
ncbi:licodione synthase-like [Olea europaea var. sylvestris]|nr:licodione synthase-like [Olea europaea var. sylvestris]CAA3031596.1 flavone synthase II [Olea europaea subsp. europaea]